MNKLKIFIILFFISFCIKTLYADEITFPDWKQNTDKIKIEYDFNGDKIKNDDITIGDYLKGVLDAEIGDFALKNYYPDCETDFKNAFIALTIAARTKLRKGVIDYNDKGKPIPITKKFQAYSYKASYEKLINDVVDGTDAGNKVIQYYSNIIDYPEYFGRAPDGTVFTKNPENCPKTYGKYSQYLRISSAEESSDLISAGTVKPDAVGMSQIGALSMSKSNKGYEDILKHYYHSAPPYVKSVKVVQGGNITGNYPYRRIDGGFLEYEKKWNDNISVSGIRDVVS